MKSGMTHAIFRGWKVASMKSNIGTLGHGRLVDANVKVRVAKKRAPGDVLGNPFLVWAPVSLISENLRALTPGDNLRLWASANDESLACMHTLDFFAKCEDEKDEDGVALEFAFLASALRMLWGYRLDLGNLVRGAAKDFLSLAGAQSADDIWGAGVWKTLPVPAPMSVGSLSCDGHEIGQFIRQWHDEIFTKFLPVEAWPVAAADSEDAPYQCTIDRGAHVRPLLENVRNSVAVHGNENWKAVSRDDLERLVWTYPRQHLARQFGVSDTAIGKRCRKEKISQPPRGFWQMIDVVRTDAMMAFLLKHNVVPPVWWDVRHSRGRQNSDSSVEGIFALSAE